MEKRITQKINTYFQDFKISLKAKIDEQNIESKESYNNIIQFLYDYQQLEINKNDFTKRKRVKNTVPFHERCCAKRANNEQCTRRKKNNELYCGTHIKGRPHGEISNKTSSKIIKKKEVWAIDIKGIIYFIDNDNNVYNHDDVMEGVENARIIAKYEKNGEEYNIPSIFNKE
tara:strand:- start:1111 stop:1626 length:516 start_codon:yes stop_codon:yes gene_type:complete